VEHPLLANIKPTVARGEIENSRPHSLDMMPF